MKWNEVIANTFRAIGARDQQGELTVAKLQERVVKDDAQTLRNLLRPAIQNQIVSRESNTGLRVNFFQEIAFDANAVEQTLIQNKVNLTASQLKNCIGSLFGNYDNATDLVLYGMAKGLPEQNGIKPKIAEQAAAKIEEIVNADYHAYQKGDHHITAKPKLTAEEFAYEKSRHDVITRIASVAFAGNLQQAEKFLSQEVSADNPVLLNQESRDKYFVALNARNQMLHTHDQNIQYIDLFMTLSKSITDAQVTAFYENRAREQDQVRADGTTLSINSPERIGNALGHAGRKVTEAATGKHLANNITATIPAEKKSPLPDHKWRGYSKLADLVGKTVKGMYAAIQTTGFVERMVGKNKPKYHLEPNEATRWNVKYENMPENYQGTQAASFYAETQARLMLDRINAAKYSANLEIALKSSPYGFTMDTVAQFNPDWQPDPNHPNEPDPYAKLKPDMKTALTKMHRDYEQWVYAQNRIAMGREALDDLAEHVKNDDTMADNKKYLNTLRTDILQLKKCNGGAELISSPYLSAVVKYDTMNNTPQKCWTKALETFLEFNDSKNAKQQAVSYQMLADLFGVRDRYQKGEVTNQELAAMMSNNGRPFNPDAARDLIDRLRNHQITPEDCRAKMHQAAEIFMQDKYQTAYNNFTLAEQTNDIMKNM